MTSSVWKQPWAAESGVYMRAGPAVATGSALGPTPSVLPQQALFPMEATYNTHAPHLVGTTYHSALVTPTHGETGPPGPPGVPGETGPAGPVWTPPLYTIPAGLAVTLQSGLTDAFGYVEAYILTWELPHDLANRYILQLLATQGGSTDITPPGQDVSGRQFYWVITGKNLVLTFPVRNRAGTLTQNAHVTNGQTVSAFTMLYLPH